MATWYLVKKWHSTFNKQMIHPVEIVRETESRLVFKSSYGGREIQVNKKSQYDNYFPTWDLAFGFLKARLENQLESFKRMVAEKENELALLLTEPRPAAGAEKEGA